MKKVKAKRLKLKAFSYPAIQLWTFRFKLSA